MSWGRSASTLRAEMNQQLPSWPWRMSCGRILARPRSSRGNRVQGSALCCVISLVTSLCRRHLKGPHGLPFLLLLPPAPAKPAPPPAAPVRSLPNGPWMALSPGMKSGSQNLSLSAEWSWRMCAN